MTAITSRELQHVIVVMLGSAGDGGPSPDGAALRQAIGPYGGRLEELGDGSTIVVLEADRHAATDHAARAARCALALRGVATGRCMAIAMGHVESLRELTGGDVLDRARRLVSRVAGAPGAPTPIAVDELTAGLLDARFEVIERDVGLVLCGERALIQGARTLLGRPTPCVGRDWELDTLMANLEAGIDEPKAQAVLLIGAAGIGKSRIGAEFVGRVQQRHGELAIWSGRGDSLRAGSTLDLLAQALRGAVGIRGSEPLAERRDLIQARVAERLHGAERERVTRFLGELVGAPFPDESEGGAALRAARHDAQLMSEQMYTAWLDFLRAETFARPVLVLLEDLHWSDFGTVRFIGTALRELCDQPWMVLAMARPELYEVFPRLWAERQVQEIRLKGLGRRAGERLVRQVLGTAVAPATIEGLVRQADGNALYLEELIRAEAEHKGKDGPLPGTVLAMVETRLARLPRHARRVLRVASVFGEVCWDGAVIALLEGAMGAGVGDLLATLVEQEVLIARRDSRFPGERELAFRHALIREGAYATLTAEDRRLAHRLAGEWLEQHGEADPMVLAGHFERGGQPARAAEFYLRAAEQALHVLDLEAVIARADLGLSCAPPQQLRLALLGARSDASRRLQRVTIGEAEELIGAAPRGSLAWARGMLAYQLRALMERRVEDLADPRVRLEEVTPDPGAAGAMSLVFLTRVFILDSFGHVAWGSAQDEAFSALVRARGEQEPLATVWWHVAIGVRGSHVYDDPWSAMQHGEAIQPICEALGSQLIFLNMQLIRGINQWYLGALASAVQTLEGIPGADTAIGMASSMRRLSLSWVHADRGAFERACAVASQLVESGRGRNNVAEQSRGRWALAEALRRMGDLAAAEREIEAALALAMPLEAPGVLATLARLRLAQDRAAEALVAAEDAMARYAAMGACGMFRAAFVRLAHAEALHATGAHDAARAAIAQARARVLAVAARISDPDYRASFLAQVPENARTLSLASTWLGEPALAGPAEG
ncbi:MAG TPA: AAA family ATPase [Kofleriaceae bacterium]|jgi:tetratricopeptide (TPR) repeat protein|nr:AAA family ATPase [Kofleriaceae bacterium]